ncbi:MAG: hypothetical protein GC193_05995 [Cryomorphaceae bacterium]|nr:hypothetical protein [Cryomorphaceae bacterium]
MREWIPRVIVVLIFIAVGFFQEWLKVNINWFIDHIAYVPNYNMLSPDDRLKELSKMDYNAPYDYYYSHSTINQLANFTSKQLAVIKYGIAIILVGFYFVLNRFAIKNILRREALMVFLRYIYIGMIATVALFFGMYFFWKHEIAMYNVGRELLGFLQSPMPIIVLYLPALFFLKNNNTA